MHTPSSLTMLLISSQPLDAKNLFFQDLFYLRVSYIARKNSFSRVHLGIHSYRLGEFLFKNLSQWDFSIVFSLQSWRGLSAKSATGFWFSNTFCGFFFFSVWVAPIQSFVFRPSESSIDLMSQSFLTSLAGLLQICLWRRSLDFEPGIYCLRCWTGPFWIFYDRFFVGVPGR